MAKIRGNGIKFGSENLVLTAGATPANEILVFCLADPGEAFIVPTPYYPGYHFCPILNHIYIYNCIMQLINLVEALSFNNFTLIWQVRQRS